MKNHHTFQHYIVCLCDNKIEYTCEGVHTKLTLPFGSVFAAAAALSAVAD